MACNKLLSNSFNRVLFRKKREKRRERDLFCCSAGAASSTSVFHLEGAAKIPRGRGKATAERLPAGWSQLASKLMVQVRTQPVTANNIISLRTQPTCTCTCTVCIHIHHMYIHVRLLEMLLESRNVCMHVHVHVVSTQI